MFFASEFAGLVGHHPYNPPPKTWMKIWQRHPSYLDTERRNAVAHDDEDLVSQLEEQVDAIIEETPVEEIAKVEMEVDHLVASVPLETRMLVREELIGHIRKSYGSRLEPVVQAELHVKDGNTKFLKRWVDERWGLGGKIDGKDDDGCIIEIKNRRSRIKSVPPMYDVIQVLTYLWVTDTKLAYLEERLMGHDDKKRTPITLGTSPRDDAIAGDSLWAECLRTAEMIVPRCQAFLIDTVKQDQYFNLMAQGLDDKAWSVLMS